jgi:hypothetical protein
MIAMEKNHLPHRWSFLDTLLNEEWSVTSLAAIYSISVLVFCLSYIFGNSLFWLVPRFVTGIVCLLIMPGLVITEIFLPRQDYRFASWILLSILLNFVAIQCSFFFRFFVNLRLELWIWLAFLDSIVALMGLAYLKQQNRSLSIKLDGLSSYEPMFRNALILGILLRVVLQIVSIGSLAPDASLYADYSRGIIDGSFTSLIQNDTAVFFFPDGIQYVAHQCFTYLFSISWMIVPPTSSGPTFLLVVIGLILLFPCYSIVERNMGPKVASAVVFILALSPIMVFHSALAYGPEILSLVFIMFSLNYILENDEPDMVLLLLSGLLAGFVDAVWYLNFYIYCMILPIIMHFGKNQDVRTTTGFTALMILTFFSRVLFSNILLYIILWVAIFSLLGIFKGFAKDLGIHRMAPMFLGVFVVISVFRSPFLLAASSVSGIVGTVPETTTLWSVVLAPLDLAIVSRFFLFIVFHTSIILFIMAILSLRDKANLKMSIAFASSALITSVATLKIFGHFTKNTLLPEYLYSDSRYFLLISVMLTFTAGFYLKRVFDLNELRMNKRFFNRRLQTTFILGVILIGFVPGYLAIPSGIALVDYEDRYGWNGLLVMTDALSTNTLVLADRAREFTWMTGLGSYMMDLGSIGLPNINASKALLYQVMKSSVDYVLVDDYTMAHWQTLDYLYTPMLKTGSSVLFNISAVVQYAHSNVTDSIASLTLANASAPNIYGRYARLYSPSTSKFNISDYLGLLDPGWAASEGGLIANESGSVNIIVGSNANYTNTYRPIPFDLDINVESGFILLEAEEVSARVARIEIWDSNGNFAGYAENIGENLYLGVLVNLTVGDIRISVEGAQGGYVTIDQMTIWQIAS